MHNLSNTKVEYSAAAAKRLNACNRNPVDDFAMVEPAVMTFERDGLPHKCLNCWVCCSICQDEMNVHAGDIQGEAGYLPEASKIGSAKMPIGGGGCTPTVEIMDRTDPNNPESQFAVVKGPTVFGGCLDLCTNTPFIINRAGGGQIGTIEKMRPDNFEQWCAAICTDADTYRMKLADTTLTPQQKSTLIAEMVHLDFMFFEQDNNFVYVRQRGNDTSVEILCCNCFCYGCLCPCKVVIPLNNNG